MTNYYASGEVTAATLHTLDRYLVCYPHPNPKRPCIIIIKEYIYIYLYRGVTIVTVIINTYERSIFIGLSFHLFLLLFYDHYISLNIYLIFAVTALLRYFP